jgi:hypothetical protein
MVADGPRRVAYQDWLPLALLDCRATRGPPELLLKLIQRC